MEHTIILLQATHIAVLLSVVKESSIFTHKFNLDSREVATDYAKLELNSLNCGYKAKITL
jgi:hypothetical protein